MLLLLSHVSAVVHTAPASGGLQSGAGATTSRLAVKTYAVSGGIASAGAASATRLTVRSATVSGGLQTGGTAAHSRSDVPAPAGGLQSGGAAALSRTRAYSGSGGGGPQTAGTAVLALTRVFAASGGASTGGTALVARGRAQTGTGGTTTGGASATAYSPAGSGSAFAYTPSGGAAFTGSAATEIVAVSASPPNSATYPAGPMRVPKPRTTTRTYAGAGEFSFGGSAETDFIPSITWEFDGRGGLRWNGSATTERFDRYARARAEDDDLLLIG